MKKYLKSLLALTDKNDRKRLWLLGSLMIVAALIELVGVGSLFPYVKVLSDPAIIHTNHYLEKVYSALSFSSQTNFLIFLGFLIFIMIIGKGGITCFNNFMQAKFSATLNNKLSNKMISSYMNMNYSEFMESNSSALSKHLLFDVRNVVAVISAILNMLTNIIVGLALVSLMLWVNPEAVLASIFLLVGFLYLTVKFTRTRMRRLGKFNEQYNRKAYKCASEAFQGVKDIKIFSAENFFIERYNQARRVLSKQLVEYNVVSTLPTIVMNVVGFGVLLMVLLYLLFTRGNMLSVLPVIAIIAICIQRLLPAANIISTSIGSVRKFRPVVFIIQETIEKMAPKEDCHALLSVEKLPFNDKLTLHNISYSYPNSEEKSLDNISLDIRKNQTIGIVGTSGAGKSTLVDVFLGLLQPSSGKIVCDELEVNENNYSKFRALIGYVPQQVFLIDGTIKENIAFGLSDETINPLKLKNAIEISQLSAFVDELPDGMNTVVGENGLKLSGGQRQRIGIARALYRDPEILIMDEATNALDAATEREFNESLTRLMTEKTMIIIAHRLTSVKFCDRLIQIEKGHIIASGTYEDLISKSDAFRKIYHLNENVDPV